MGLLKMGALAVGCFAVGYVGSVLIDKAVGRIMDKEAEKADAKMRAKGQEFVRSVQLSKGRELRFYRPML